MPSLIAQGLNGPRLLLQGLGSGNSTLATSGGFSLGGQAAAMAAVAVAASGGVSAGAAAAYARSAQFAAAGGARLGGPSAAWTAFATAGGGGLALGGSRISTRIVYRIYSSGSQGGPVLYGIPLATVEKPTWTSGTLAAPGQYKLAVRTFDAFTGLEDGNVDAVVRLSLDADGRDVTDVPLPPFGLRALARPGAAVRIEWCWNDPGCDPTRRPTAFRVSLGTGGSSARTVATLPWLSGRNGCFGMDLMPGVAAGTPCTITVCSVSEAGLESPPRSVTVTADGTPPAPIDSLTAAATNQEA